MCRNEFRIFIKMHYFFFDFTISLGLFLKLNFSEKATQIWDNLPPGLDITYLTSKPRGINFVVFSDHVNFIDRKFYRIAC